MSDIRLIRLLTLSASTISHYTFTIHASQLFSIYVTANTLTMHTTNKTSMMAII